MNVQIHYPRSILKLRMPIRSPRDHAGRSGILSRRELQRAVAAMID